MELYPGTFGEITFTAKDAKDAKGINIAEFFIKTAIPDSLLVRVVCHIGKQVSLTSRP
jgi:hypothetical protein